MSRLLFDVFKTTNHLLSIYLIKTCNQKAGHSRPRKEEGCVMFVFVLEKKKWNVWKNYNNVTSVKRQQYNINSRDDSWQLQTKQKKSFKPFELFPKLMKQVKYTINPISLFVKHNFSVYIQLWFFFFHKRYVCNRKSRKET